MSEKTAAAAFPETSDSAPEPASGHRPGWFAAGGVVGAVLASACCILPLVLLTLGVSGAWIGNLTALQPFKPYFAAVALIFVGFGFRQVYFRPASDCAAGTRCRLPRSSAVVKPALWLATLLVASALTVNWWAPLLY